MADTTWPPRTPRVEVDVALSASSCSTPGCLRVVLPGETLYMRSDSNERPHVSFPLCPVCAAAVIEDNKQRARVWLHAEQQRKELARQIPITEEEPRG